MNELDNYRIHPKTMNSDYHHQLHDARIGSSVGNPQKSLAEMDTFFRENRSDYKQDQAYIYSLNPDQIQRPEIPIPKNNYKNYFEKGLSGLSSESINRDLLMWNRRGKIVMAKNREIYRGFI